MYAKHTHKARSRGRPTNMHNGWRALSVYPLFASCVFMRWDCREGTELQYLSTQMDTAVTQSFWMLENTQTQLLFLISGDSGWGFPPYLQLQWLKKHMGHVMLPLVYIISIMVSLLHTDNCFQPHRSRNISKLVAARLTNHTEEKKSVCSNFRKGWNQKKFCSLTEEQPHFGWLDSCMAQWMV